MSNCNPDAWATGGGFRQPEKLTSHDGFTRDGVDFPLDLPESAETFPILIAFDLADKLN